MEGRHDGASLWGCLSISTPHKEVFSGFLQVVGNQLFVDLLIRAPRDHLPRRERREIWCGVERGVKAPP